jgi:dihydropteroate synthase
MNPKLMGVVNVTPDSFSDGGLYLDAGAAVRHGEELVGDGAEILDVGGESTRPGAEPVGEGEELRRVVPVVKALVGKATVSIDTSKAAVAEAALEVGAEIVNDVTALRGDPAMASLCAERGVGVVLMHMPGNPRTMQDDPSYDDVVDEVKAFLAERTAFGVG